MRAQNFWIELQIDGRIRKIAVGPQAVNGGFRAIFMQRDHGKILRAAEICGKCEGTVLTLEAWDLYSPDDSRKMMIRTER
jgi:hypothetical protein